MDVDSLQPSRQVVTRSIWPHVSERLEDREARNGVWSKVGQLPFRSGEFAILRGKLVQSESQRFSGVVSYVTDAEGVATCMQRGHASLASKTLRVGAC
eukprot:4040424-Pleurochrysis_carterae.AAC.1